MKIKIKCDFCNKIIFKFICYFNRHNHHFCNHKCKNKYFHKYGYGHRKTIICKQCSKPKTVCKASTAKFCSRKCFAKWMSLHWKGKNNPHYDRKWSEESRINMSKNWHKAKKRVKHLEMLNRTKKRFGKNNPNYIDGSSLGEYGSEFNDELKEFIKKRDKYICQNPDCGIYERECRISLRTHHIDYHKDNNDPINLISLCNSCHMKSNFNRLYWQSFYENIQIKRQVHLLERVIEEKENYTIC